MRKNKFKITLRLITILSILVGFFVTMSVANNQLWLFGRSAEGAILSKSFLVFALLTIVLLYNIIQLQRTVRKIRRINKIKMRRHINFIVYGKYLDK